MNSEPALTIGGITAIIQAGVASLVAGGGFNLSTKQEGAIVAFTTLAIGLLSAILVRMHVFAPTTVAKIQSGEVTVGAPGPHSLGIGMLASAPRQPGAGAVASDFQAAQRLAAQRQAVLPMGGAAPVARPGGKG